jgi:hypothetical protein
MILPKDQRLAEIDVWERKGQSKIRLASPNVTYLVGHDATFAAGGDSGGLELRIHSLSDKKPIQHVIEAKLIGDRKGKNPVTMIVPKLTLNDNTRGIVSAKEADGSELFVEVAILSSDATTEPDTRTAKKVEASLANDQRLPPSCGSGKITEGGKNQPSSSAPAPLAKSPTAAHAKMPVSVPATAVGPYASPHATKTTVSALTKTPRFYQAAQPMPTGPEAASGKAIWNRRRLRPRVWGRS